MSRLQTLLPRLIQALITLLGVVTLVFFLQRLAGDPVLLMLPETATAQEISALRHSLGFDRPLWLQYLSFLASAVHLDLGDSLVQQVSVLSIIASRLPYTLALAAAALFIAIGLGIPMGAVLAMSSKRWLRGALEVLLAIVQSVPTFWSGMLLMLIFALTLGWLPASGSGTWQHLLLPALALGLFNLASFARITQRALSEELARDYVRSAVARGVGPMRLLLRHLSRNAALPLLAVAGLEVASLLAGAVVVEGLFAWPGLGQLSLQAILSRDFPLIQAIVLLGAFCTIGLNLLTDVLYGVLDPRIKHAQVSR